MLTYDFQNNCQLFQLHLSMASHHIQKSFWDTFLSLFAHPIIIFGLILCEEEIGVSLGRTFLVGIIHEVLDTHEQLRNGERWTPVLIFVQYAEADRATGIDVRMEQNRSEFAFWRLVGVVFRELHHQLIDSTLPWRAFLPRNLTLPFEQILTLSIGRSYRLGRKTKRMLFPPILTLLHQSLLRDIHQITNL